MLLVSLEAGGGTMETPMRKLLARAARLVRKVSEFLIPVLTVIKLFVELLNKAANCNDRKLQFQVSNAW
jgi:hypothetical protein